MSKDDGGAAFPTRTYELDGQHNYVYYDENGMTLRDWFAGQALASWGETHHGLAFGLHGDGDYDETVIATIAYRLADAMLAEREKAKP